MMKSVLSRLGSFNSSRKSASFSNEDLDERIAKEERKHHETKRKDIAQIARSLKYESETERKQSLLDILRKDVALYSKDKALDLLAQGMADSDTEVRFTAVKVLRQVMAQSFETPVEHHDCGPCGLEHPNLDDRVAAARAMGRMVCPSDVKVVAMLANRLAVPEYPRVQDAAGDVLCQVALRLYQKAMQIVSRAFEDSNAAIRRDALNFVAIFATSSNREHIDIISCGLRDPAAEVRLAARNANAKLEDRGSETALELFLAHTLEKSDAGIRKVAMSTARRVGNVSEYDPFEPTGPKMGRRSNASDSARRGGA